MTTQELQELFQNSTDEKIHQNLELIKYNPDYVKWLENIIVNNPALDPQKLKFDQEKSIQDPFYKPFYLKEVESKPNSTDSKKNTEPFKIDMKNKSFESIQMKNSRGDVILIEDSFYGWNCKINKGNSFFINSFWGNYPGKIQVVGETKSE